MLASRRPTISGRPLTKLWEAANVDAFLVQADLIAAEIVLFLLIIYGTIHAGCFILRLVLKDLKSAQDSLNKFSRPRKPSG